MLRKALERAGHAVDEAPDGSSAVAKVRARRYMLVLTDLKLPGCSGLDVLRETKQADPTIPVILITAYGSVEEAVTAMKEGAYDFIQKPVDLEHLESAGRARRPAAGIAARKSSAPRRVHRTLRLPAHRRRTQDHAGSHASGAARGRHRFDGAAAGSKAEPARNSLRAPFTIFPPARQHPFVALNCAAIPEGLVENELFGHERGAYTGAGSRKVGKMELANRGTIFLDEIARTAAHHAGQTLARARGDAASSASAARNSSKSTCASWRPPTRICAKPWRPRRFARICTSASPPCPSRFLRCSERGDDVLMLAEHFLDRFRREFRKPDLKFAASASAALRGYAWPGNVRELQNTIERAAILSDAETIDAADLQLPAPRPPEGTCPKAWWNDAFDWGGTLQEVGDARGGTRRAIQDRSRAEIDAME